MDDAVDSEQQSLELEALKCIYNEEEFITYVDEKSGLVHLQFYAFVTLPDNFSVIFNDDENHLNPVENATVETASNDNEKTQNYVLEVKYLPPIELFAVLRKDYPAKSSPQFTLSCSWLSVEAVSKLCKKLDSLWEENIFSEILYVWMTFLQEETLVYLELENVLHIDRKNLKQNERTQKIEHLNNKEIILQNGNCTASTSVTDDNGAVKGETSFETCDSSSTDGGCSNQSCDVPSLIDIKETIETNDCMSLKTESDKLQTARDKEENKSSTQSEHEISNRNKSYNDRYFYRGNFPASNRRNNNRRHNNYDSRRNYDRYPRNNTYKSDQHVQSRDRFRKNSEHDNYNRRRGRWNDASRKHVTTYKKDNIEDVASNVDSVVILQEKLNSELVLNNDVASGREQSSSRRTNCEQNSNEVSAMCNIKKSESSDDVHKVNNESSTTSSIEKCDTNKDGRVKECLSQYHLEKLLGYLDSYNKDRMLTEFCKMFFTCSICYQDKQGLHCTQFKPCNHTFCKDCVSQYVQIKINEGTVYVIKCPEDKCTSDITPSQVRDLVGPEQFARYDNILLTTTLETMTDVITCPRRMCQYPATRDPDEKMAVCPACRYVFCTFCKMGFHGVEPCRFRTDEKAALVKEYMEADNEMKLALEHKYGKKQLNSLVQASLSESWIVNNSQNCPHCNASIEKSGGCNKMICWRCSTFFCWICGARLNPAQNPYKHYYDPKSKCYQQLFEGVVSDDEDNDLFILDELELEEEDDEEPIFL